MNNIQISSQQHSLFFVKSAIFLRKYTTNFKILFLYLLSIKVYLFSFLYLWPLILKCPNSFWIQLIKYIPLIKRWKPRERQSEPGLLQASITWSYREAQRRRGRYSFVSSDRFEREPVRVQKSTSRKPTRLRTRQLRVSLSTRIQSKLLVPFSILKEIQF